MKTNISKIKFAIVGHGRIGKRHATMIEANSETELVAICDINPKQRKENVPFFDNIEHLLTSEIAIDVVCICTPNGLHATHALKVLTALKHVVIEKPMALSKRDCEQLIYKSLNVSKHIFCVMQNRYSPPSVWLKEVVDRKYLGQIFLVQINCYWNRDDRYYSHSDWHGSLELDGGVLFTQFSHFIDIMYWLFGDIENIHAKFENYNHQHSTEFEDTGAINFDFVNGGTGILNYSTAVWNSNFESSMTLIGEKGTIKVGGQYMEKIEYCNVEAYEMPELDPINPPNDYGAYKGSAANHHFVIENVVDALKGRKPITTNALEGLKVVDIIERIYENK